MLGVDVEGGIEMLRARKKIMSNGSAKLNDLDLNFDIEWCKNSATY